MKNARISAAVPPFSCLKNSTPAAANDETECPDGKEKPDPNSMIIEKVTNELIAYSKEKKPPV